MQAVGFTAAVTVNATALPAGITSAPAVIAGSTGTLVFTGNGTAAIGTTFVATLAGAGGGATGAGSLDGIVSGPSGSLDTTYPASGAFASGWGTIRNCFVQPDGKVVLVGRFAPNGRSPSLVLRLTVDGAIDTTFTPPTGSFDAGGGDIGLAAALQPDGNIVVASLTSGTTRISRYLTTGAYDASFQGQGWVTSPTISLTDPGPAAPVMFVLQPNGDITIGGRRRLVGRGPPAMARGTRDGRSVPRDARELRVRDGGGELLAPAGRDPAVARGRAGQLPLRHGKRRPVVGLLGDLPAQAPLHDGARHDLRYARHGRGPHVLSRGAPGLLRRQRSSHCSPAGLPATGSTFFGFDTFDSDGTNHMILMPAGAGVDPMTTSSTIGTDAAGNILLAGGALAVARFTPSRTLDTTFAGQGGETVSGVTGTPVCITGTSEGATLVGVTDTHTAGGRSLLALTDGNGGPRGPRHRLGCPRGRSTGGETGRRSGFRFRRREA